MTFPNCSHVSMSQYLDVQPRSVSNVNRPHLARHFSAIQNGNRRSEYEQQPTALRHAPNRNYVSSRESSRAGIKKKPRPKGEALYLMPGSCLQDVGRSRSAWMRGSDQAVQKLVNLKYPPTPNYGKLRESSLGGINKKAPPKGRGFLIDAWQ